MVGWFKCIFSYDFSKKWFCKYERYDENDIFLADDSMDGIIGWGKFKLNFIDGRIRTFLSIFYISRLARNLIFVSQMSDVGVKTMCEKKTSNSSGKGISKRSSNWNSI